MINLLIKIYQILGLVKHQLLVSVFGFSCYCKHTPTCSRYFVQEVKRRGTIGGLYKGFFRLITCW